MLLGCNGEAPDAEVPSRIDKPSMGIGAVFDLTRDQLARQIRSENGRSGINQIVEPRDEPARGGVEKLVLLLQPDGEVGGSGESLTHAVEN